MGKRNFNAPKRATWRQINEFTDFNGSSGDFTLFTADEAITLTRTIIDGWVNAEAVSGATQNLDCEIWRKRTGVALPTWDIANGIDYSQNDDLIVKFKASLMRETTSSGNVLRIFYDLKSKRKLKAGQTLVFRFNGSSAMILNALITQFLLET